MIGKKLIRSVGIKVTESDSQAGSVVRVKVYQV
jgi:hypothetical protein